MSVNTNTNTKVRQIRERVDQVLTARHDELYETVRACVVEVLDIDPAKVSPNASLIGELGAESLDFLDLLFRLESAYGIKIPRDGIRHAVQDGLSDGFEKNGVLTEEALDRLRTLMPEVDSARIKPGLSSRGIPELFTIETFVRLVAWRLADQQAHA